MRSLLFLGLLVGLATTADAQVQTLNPSQLGVIGQGMNFGSFGSGMNGSGFVPGGQNMGGQALSLNQYMAARMLMGLAGGRHGVRRGVANPFINTNQPTQASQPMMSLPPPKSSKASVTRLTPAERKANAKAAVEARRAKVAAAAAERKAKAAEKAAQKAARQQAAAQK